MIRPLYFLFFLVLFLGCPWDSWGFQTTEVPKDFSMLEGKERAIVLNQLATDLRESDHATTMAYSLEADSIGKALNDPSIRSRALENIGWVYYRKGNWLKTFEFSQQAYKLAISANDKLQAARLMNNMGALYYEQQNHPKSIEQFRKGYELATEVNDLGTRIRSLNNMALNFTQSGQQDSALHYAQISIKLNTEAGSPYLTSFAHRVIGDVYLAKGNYDTAQVIYQKTLDMARTQQVKSFEAGVLHRLGNAYLLNGEYQKAEEILKYSVDFCEENQYLDELSKSHKYLATVFERKGDIPRAYFHQSKFLILNDSMVNKANRDRLALLQGMFEEDLANSELQLLKAQNENQAYRLETSKRYSIFFALTAVIIFLLVIRLYWLNRNVNKINTDLLDQQRKIEDQNQILACQSTELKAINETKNKLFSILGHDLRGPIAQMKSVIDLLLQDQLDKEEFLELVSFLKKDVDSVNFTLNNTLKWSMAQMEGFEIHPVNFNLNEQVNNSLALLQASIKEKNLIIFNQLPFEVKVFGDPDLIEVVIRNVINNAVKFSNPGDAISLFAEKENSWLKFFVLDQGVGMNQEQIDEILADTYSLTRSKPGTQKEKGSGLGLQLVKEFVKMNGGGIEIDSHPGHGTKLCLKFPVSREESQALGHQEILNG